MIYYLGCYKTGKIEDLLPSGSINAGSFKMSYLIRTVKELGQEITVLSTYDSRKPGLRPYRKARVDDLETDLFFPAFSLPGAGARLGRMVKSLMDLVCLLLFVKPGATLMVYHHPAFARFLPLVKHLKRVRVILEVEEMYHVLEGSRKTFAKERKLLDLADSYLVSNDLIYPEYLRTDRDCAVVYGNYTIPEHPPVGKHDGINILYSGSIDRVRGAFLAVEIARFLPEGYCLHLSGAGQPQDVAELERLISGINAGKPRPTVIYHGQLDDAGLDRLAFSCDIGLNLQDAQNPFHAVSFPSKIPFYLARGLSVFSTRLSSVMASKLSPCVTYVDMDPQSIAEEILVFRPEVPEANRKRIAELDREFSEELSRLLGIARET